MRKSLEDVKHMVRPQKYPGNLPDELKPYNYYVIDGGHCIMCVLECHLEQAKEDMDGYEIPVPVKYVLEKGYRFVDDHVTVEAEYDRNFGLDIDDKYFEF